MSVSHTDINRFNNRRAYPFAPKPRATLAESNTSTEINTGEPIKINTPPVLLNKHKSDLKNIEKLFDENDVISSSSSDNDEKELNDLLKINQSSPSVPIENINLCFVGGVSTGKSTVLNSIFCEELTQCKIKRTTMVPTIYIENPTNDYRDKTEDIFSAISKKNEEIINKTEHGIIDPSDYKEMIFNVGPLDVNILPNTLVNVYDIPGLNDARTKDVYYSYLRESFHKFNLVIFMVDIHSGLNTSDEFDIVNFITSNTRLHKDKNNKSIYTLVVVNKADDMQLNDENDNLELNGELKEMFDQVNHTITAEFTKKNILEHLIGIIPLCAIDAYLYRMVKYFGSNFKLSKEQILKIGINENGKKFSTYSHAVQEEKVTQILKDEEFINTMICLSGFKEFINKLQTFLKNINAEKQMPIENLEYELKQLYPISKVSYTSELITVIKQHYEIISKMKFISIETYNNHMLTAMENIQKYIETHIIASQLSVHALVSAYEDVWDTIFKEYFSEFIPKEIIYPTNLVQKIINIRKHTFKNYLICLRTISETFEQLIRIGEFNSNTVKELLSELYHNPRKEKSITALHLTNSIITCIEIMNSNGIDKNEIIKFMRFIIISELHTLSPRDLLHKQLFYKEHNEHVITTYINNVLAPSLYIADYINYQYTEQDQNILDSYYVSYIKKYLKVIL